MVGNNLARDIKGANALGLIGIWFAWNARYPLAPVDEAAEPDYQVGTAEELQNVLTALDDGADASRIRWPRSHPWNSATRLTTTDRTM